jgi:hypothetical protein
VLQATYAAYYDGFHTEDETGRILDSETEEVTAARLEETMARITPLLAAQGIRRVRCKKTHCVTPCCITRLAMMQQQEEEEEEEEEEEKEEQEEEEEEKE